jgi:SAM-dependent methyltransferase
VSASFVRVGPVHFQTLEQELAPVVQYLTGHLLNAGAGERDISAWLRTRGVTEITRYDLSSNDPDVVIGPLEKMPFADATFDSVLCNAVLEHVVDADAAMREIARVVKPGGAVIVAVPFLQPFHPCPGDYRRYTADGLADLGRRALLDVVAVLPVHSIAQTIGWILWEWARERGGTVRRSLAWALSWLITRLSLETDAKAKNNANTFQAVFVRPSTPNAMLSEWWRWPYPAQRSIPTMLTLVELRMLNRLADEHYTGAGCIVDAGCFLGGSTTALADGLRRNLRRRGLAETKRIHSFDRFEVEDYTRGTFFPKSMPAGSSFRASFESNVAPYKELVEVHAGDITEYEWTGEPIEILFIDVAKHWTVCDWVTRQFFPALIPGRSIVVQQDYLYHHWNAWLHVTMELYREYFEYVGDTDVNSAVFRYVKKIPDDVLREKSVESLGLDEKRELMDRAASRFEGRKRELLLSAKEHFLELLATP